MSKKTDRLLPDHFQLPQTGVDTHAHLDLKPLADNIPAYINNAQRAGVKFIGNVFLGLDAYRKNAHLFDDFAHVFFLLGCHPHDARQFKSSHLKEMQDLFSKEPRLKALGEIGLDYYRDYCPHDIQKTAFEQQLQLAYDLSLPVVIHSRDAETDVITMLLDKGFKNRKVLWHCFGQGMDLAEKIIDYGWLLSIPGTVTFPKNTELHEVAQRIPADSFVLETDCPFLTPVPYRGKTNEPAFTAFIADYIARLRNVDTASLWKQCAHNASRFFSLD